MTPERLLPDCLRVASVTGLAFWFCGFAAGPAFAADPGVAVLLVDTDRAAGTIDERIYGHFLEEINHSVVDGLYAEQVRGQGFEGKDFADYWTPFGTGGEATLFATAFERGEQSVRLAAAGGTVAYRDDALGYLRADVPTKSVRALAGDPSIQALDLDGVVSGAFRERGVQPSLTGEREQTHDAAYLHDVSPTAVEG